MLCGASHRCLQQACAKGARTPGSGSVGALCVGPCLVMLSPWPKRSAPILNSHGPCRASNIVGCVLIIQGWRVVSIGHVAHACHAKSVNAHGARRSRTVSCLVACCLLCQACLKWAIADHKGTTVIVGCPRAPPNLKHSSEPISICHNAKDRAFGGLCGGSCCLSLPLGFRLGVWVGI